MPTNNGSIFDQRRGASGNGVSLEEFRAYASMIGTDGRVRSLPEFQSFLSLLDRMRREIVALKAAAAPPASGSGGSGTSGGGTTTVLVGGGQLTTMLPVARYQPNLTLNVGDLVTCFNGTIRLADVTASAADGEATHIVASVSSANTPTTAIAFLAKEAAVVKVKFAANRGFDSAGRIYTYTAGSVTDVKGDIVDGGGAPVGSCKFLQPIGQVIRIGSYGAAYSPGDGYAYASISILPGASLV